MIGKRIRALRRERDLTQQQVADALGLSSQATISMIENGTNKPSIEVAMGLARLFGVSLDELLANGNGDAAIQPEAEVCEPA